MAIFSRNEPKLPTASDNGTTVCLIKKFGGEEKRHKRASAEVRAQNNVTNKKRAKVTVNIFDCEYRAAAMKRARALDVWIRTRTLPWGNDQRRWLANTRKTEFDDYTKKEIRECDALMAKHFDPDNWNKIKGRWEAEAGLLGAEVQFPSREEYMGKYKLEIEPGTVIDVDRIQPGALSGEQRERFVKDVRAAEQKRVGGAVKDVFKRILETMAETIKVEDYKVDKDGNKSGVFRDSKIRNVEVLADTLKDLNFTGDKEIDAIRRKIINEIACKDPGMLRENEPERKKVAQSAKEIAAKATATLAGWGDS